MKIESKRILKLISNEINKIKKVEINNNNEILEIIIITEENSVIENNISSIVLDYIENNYEDEDITSYSINKSIEDNYEQLTLKIELL